MANNVTGYRIVTLLGGRSFRLDTLTDAMHWARKLSKRYGHMAVEIHRTDWQGRPYVITFATVSRED